jgi:hypothetical protein
MPKCNDQGLVSFVEGLHLPKAVDYLGVYLSQSVGSATLYQSTGTPCAGAADPNTCKATLLSGVPSMGFPSVYLPNVPSILPPYSYMYVAYTRGDSVSFVSDRAQLNGFLGDIDTVNEAGLVFLSMGVGPACAAISETGTGYYYSTPYVPNGCGLFPTGQVLSVTHAGAVSSTSVGTSVPCVGRRPDGLREARASRSHSVGEYYASIAHLEAAAVLAFDIIERDLARFDAPHDLRVRVQRARADEVRHASRMAEFARRWDTPIPRAEAISATDRTLLAAALENAVEGCVREAWGALSAHYQAGMAREPDAARLWREIAADETEHAELSFALHEWYMSQLAADERDLVEAALQRARLELRAELAFAPAPDAAVLHHAGVPDPACAVALFRELETLVLAA